MKKLLHLAETMGGGISFSLAIAGHIRPAMIVITLTLFVHLINHDLA